MTSPGRFEIGDRVILMRPYTCGLAPKDPMHHPGIGTTGEVVGLYIPSNNDSNLPSQCLVSWLYDGPAGNEFYVDEPCLDPFAPPPNLRDRTAVEQWLDA